MIECNSYIISEEGKTVATFLAGKYHSGNRYFVITIGKFQAIVERNKIRYRQYGYTVYNRQTKQQIGSFYYRGSWYRRLLGILTTDREFKVEQYNVSKLFEPATWKQVWFRIYDNSTTIDYFGKVDSIFNGRIELYGSGKILEALIGLCMIDEKGRTDEENSAT